MTGAMDVDHFQDVQIFDERGVNVTPKSLAHLAEARKPATRGKDAGGVAFAEELGSGPASAPVASALPAARASRPDAAAPTPSEVVLDPELLGETEADEAKNLSPTNARATETRDADEGDVQTKKSLTLEATTVETAVDTETVESTEPEPEVHITLSESDTFVLFKAPGRCVPSDDPAADAFERRNAAYKELLEKKVGSEAYVDASAQTVNLLRKEKLSQSAVVTRTEQASQSSVWEIYDRVVGTDTAAGADASASASASARDAEASVSGVSSALGVGAKSVEKAILQNLYQDKMLLYRNYRVADVGPNRTDAETNATGRRGGILRRRETRPRALVGLHLRRDARARSDLRGVEQARAGCAGGRVRFAAGGK
jgi:hypothetical protein